MTAFIIVNIFLDIFHFLDKMLTINRGVLQSNQNLVLKCSFSGDFDDISVNIQEAGRRFLYLPTNQEFKRK